MTTATYYGDPTGAVTCTTHSGAALLSALEAQGELPAVFTSRGIYDRLSAQEVGDLTDIFGASPCDACRSRKA